VTKSLLSSNYSEKDDALEAVVTSDNLPATDTSFKHHKLAPSNENSVIDAAKSLPQTKSDNRSPSPSRQTVSSQIQERNRILIKVSQSKLNEGELLNRSTDSETSNCPICLESLKRKHSKHFKCKLHFGHIDCIEHFYLNQEEPFVCPYKCNK